MKAPANWRAVGQAMRWARQQEGVTVRRMVVDNSWPVTIDLEWKRPDGHSVLVTWATNREWVDVYAGGPVDDVHMSNCGDAATVLRVLAALDLIPAELAQVHDEDRPGQRASHRQLMAAQEQLGKARDIETRAGRLGAADVLNSLVVSLFQIALDDEFDQLADRAYSARLASRARGVAE
jgi:hypothetical protein